MKNRNTPIAMEGIPFIATGIIAGGLLWTAGFRLTSLFPFLLAIFSLYFFRNPVRRPPSIPGSVIAPADGTVIFRGTAQDEFTGVAAEKISIFMSVFDVHINRAPVSGRVVERIHRPGRFLDVRNDRATFENERLALVVETDDGKRLTVVQVAGLIARRIVCYPEKGERITAGERYGLIRFGSRLDVYLPIGSEINVSLGDRTTAGETIVGRL